MLYEVALTTKPTGKVILAFDGRVLEFFAPTRQEGSNRYHVTHLTAIELSQDKKGKLGLDIKTRSGESLWSEVDQESLPAAQELVGAVQQAIVAAARQ